MTIFVMKYRYCAKLPCAGYIFFRQVPKCLVLGHKVVCHNITIFGHGNMVFGSLIFGIHHFVFYIIVFVYVAHKSHNMQICGLWPLLLLLLFITSTTYVPITFWLLEMTMWFVATAIWSLICGPWHPLNHVPIVMKVTNKGPSDVKSM